MENNMEKALNLRIDKNDRIDLIMQNLLHLEGFESTAINKKMINVTYYDTENKDLLLSDLEYAIREEDTLRVAIINRRNQNKPINFIQEKQEWSVIIEGPSPDIEFFRNDSLYLELEKIVNKSELIPIFHCSFTREKINLLNDNETWIEMSADQGEIFAGDLKTPINALQIKLKKGNNSDILRLASILIENNSLMIDEKSWYDRGLELLAIHPIEVSQKSFIKLKPKDRVTESAERILQFGMNEITRTYTYLLTHLEDPESNHQIRVKIRKLRAILAFFMPLLGQKEYLEQQEKLRKMGLKFSELRQMDVLVEELDKMSADSIVPLVEFDFLTNKLKGKREEALKSLAVYLKKNDLMLAILDLWIWLLDDPWEDSPLLELSIEKYTEKNLNLWLKKINKGLKNMNMEHQEEIHKVRIKSKKLRYIMEQLSSILDKDTKKSIIKFEKLQDDLGYFHDVYANKAFLEQLIAKSGEKQLHYEAGIFIGWQTLQGNIKMSKYL